MLHFKIVPMNSWNICDGLNCFSYHFGVYNIKINEKSINFFHGEIYGKMDEPIEAVPPVFFATLRSNSRIYKKKNLKTLQ